MKSLYELSTEIKNIELIMENIESADEVKDIATHQNLLFAMIQSETDYCVYYLQSLEDYSTLVNFRLDELKKMQDKIEKRCENFKNYLMKCLNALETEEITGKLYKISKTTPRASVVVEDIDKLPVEFVAVKTTYTPKKDEIQKAIKNGDKVDGATLVMGEPKIKIKGAK